VAAASVAFECTLERFVHIGEGPLAANVVFGSIRRAHIRDDVLDSQGHVDAAKLDAIGRMGGDCYTRTRETFDLKRPDR
ncbi:MAG TPA: flavin reductase family protein, partial [Opitutaceae bacterium]|nr:flavin reductase family protein [Opitutaceae bacterium]